uniref:Ig-like domain-containing protein n=1 Tax=Acanthochromis polyacanthus TaxID=80966 RepID=A0A3Q1F2V3_9TELE
MFFFLTVGFPWLIGCMVALSTLDWIFHISLMNLSLPSGTLLKPTLTLLSPHTVFTPGEAVRFGCSALLGHHLSDFHLYKHGVSTPLVTQRADQAQTRVELTLSDIETFHQGSYSCRYRIKGGFPSQLLIELLTPQHWFNTSTEAPAGSVIKGHSFNITCSTPQQYPGGSFQLRLIRSNGTVRQSLPALTPSVTFTFPSAQSSNEGYYYCLYRVQLGGRTFVSRESQPLPIAIRGETEEENEVFNPPVVLIYRHQKILFPCLKKIQKFSKKIPQISENLQNLQEENSNNFLKVLFK